MKTNKSITKRIKISSTGKLSSRKPGFNHFNAKQSRVEQLAGRKMRPFTIDRKTKSRVLPYSN